MIGWAMAHLANPTASLDLKLFEAYGVQRFHSQEIHASDQFYYIAKNKEIYGIVWYISQ